MAQRFPVFTGPPAPRPDGSSVYFATDDYRLNAPLPKGSTAPKDAVPTLTIPGIATPVPLFYLATAAPRAR